MRTAKLAQRVNATDGVNHVGAAPDEGRHVHMRSIAKRELSLIRPWGTFSRREKEP